jgi:hypothetical protein
MGMVNDKAFGLRSHRSNMMCQSTFMAFERLDQYILSLGEMMMHREKMLIMRFILFDVS